MRFLRSFSYWAFVLLLSIGIGRALGGSKLIAFSHSLDVHADKAAIEKAYHDRVKAEERDRKEKAEQRKRDEENKRYKELKAALDKEKTRLVEEKAKAAREERERKAKKK